LTNIKFDNLFVVTGQLFCEKNFYLGTRYILSPFLEDGHLLSSKISEKQLGFNLKDHQSDEMMMIVVTFAVCSEVSTFNTAQLSYQVNFTLLNSY
jgi:hypothetical protein